MPLLIESGQEDGEDGPVACLILIAAKFQPSTVLLDQSESRSYAMGPEPTVDHDEIRRWAKPHGASASYCAACFVRVLRTVVHSTSSSRWLLEPHFA